MEIFLECLPCMLQQSLDAARMATDDYQLQEKIVEDSMKISKGQGNFEALSESDNNIFFLLKAKCQMISKRLGVDYMNIVLACIIRVIDICLKQSIIKSVKRNGLRRGSSTNNVLAI